MEPSHDPLVSEHASPRWVMTLAGGSLAACLLLGLGLWFAVIKPRADAEAEATQAARYNAASTAIAAEATATADAWHRWPAIITDDFAEEAHDWNWGEHTGRFADGHFTITDGHYRWDLDSHEGMIWPSLPDDTRLTEDFYASVEARQISGTTNLDYGLIFRRAEQNYYYLHISPATGDVALDRYQFEKWTPLLAWTPMAYAINTQSANRLEIIGRGNTFKFYINGQTLNSITDNELASGSVGVAVQIYEPNEQAVVEFDNFEWRSPP